MPPAPSSDPSSHPNSQSKSSSPSHFGDALIERVRALGHPLCVGLDPHLALVPPPFRRGAMVPAAPATADAIEELCSALVDRVADRVAAVKPQVAFFEQLGWRGQRALENVVHRARGAGLLVVVDAKRGDIGSTAQGYAAEYFGAHAPVAAHALTVNPYLGLDSLAPFVDAARANGGGLFVLAKTSNPGSGDLQDLEVDGVPVFARVAASLAPACSALAGPSTGWSSLGVVVGATHPAQHALVREQLPRAVFLVPGYGAQGAGARDAVCGFVPGPSGLEGGIVSSSRAIAFPDGPSGGGCADAASWERAVDAALDRAIAELGDAVSRT